MPALGPVFVPQSIRGEDPFPSQLQSGPTQNLGGEQYPNALRYGYYNLYSTETGFYTPGTMGMQAGPVNLMDNPPIPGKVYQNTYDYPITLYIPVVFNPTSSTDAIFSVYMGPTETPSLIFYEMEPAGFTAGSVRTSQVRVPPNNYFAVTADLASMQTVTPLGI